MLVYRFVKAYEEIVFRCFRIAIILCKSEGQYLAKCI